MFVLALPAPIQAIPITGCTLSCKLSAAPTIPTWIRTPDWRNLLSHQRPQNENERKRGAQSYRRIIGGRKYWAQWGSGKYRGPQFVVCVEGAKKYVHKEHEISCNKTPAKITQFHFRLKRSEGGMKARCNIYVKACIKVDFFMRVAMCFND